MNTLFLSPDNIAQPYGGGSQQSGLYPSPYQARHRLHSKHGSRGYKRRANASAGGDGVPAAFGAGSSGGVGLAFSSSSTNSHQRGKNERDRFLVDINSGGGQRGGVAAPSTLLHARKDVSLQIERDQERDQERERERQT